MPEDVPIATHDSWKVQEPSGTFAELPYKQEFSTKQSEQIRRGLIPRQMEDKWFIYFDNPWLYLHRSWTGLLIYRVRFEETHDGFTAVFAEVLADGQHSEEYDARLLDFLIRGLLLSERVPFPVPEEVQNDYGLYQHHIAGTAAEETPVRDGHPISLIKNFVSSLLRRGR